MPTLTQEPWSPPGGGRLRRETRRAQLIEAADKVFTGRDPSLVSFEEIADAAGVSRALVYNYFGDRQGLLIEVQRFRIARLLDSLHTDESIDQHTRFASMVAAHVTAATDHPDVYAAATRDSEHLDELADERRVLVTGLVGSLPGGDAVADAVVAAVCSAARRWAGRLDRDALIDQVTQLLWSGLGSLPTTHTSPPVDATQP
jgi:AcrR family transcriptional regulator